MNTNKMILTAMLIAGCNIAYAAPSLPNTNSELRALEENRGYTQAVTLGQEQPNNSVQGAQELFLKKFKLVCAEDLNTQPIEALISEYYERKVSIDEMQQASNTVTNYLRKQGYAVATAFLPPQQVQDNIVEMRIVLGRLDKVEINNNSRLHQATLERLTGGLQTNELLKTNKLESVLNNINDLSGVSTVGVLRAGDAVGSSRFVVNVQDEKLFDGAIYTDNHGNKYSGRYRYGFQTNINNPGKVGDKISITGMISNGDLHNYSIGYEAPVGRGSKLGVSYSLMDYTLGDYYNILGAVGKSKTLSIYGSTPFINTSDRYISAVYGYNHRQLEDELRTFNFSTQKHSNSVYLGAAGNYRQLGQYTAYSAIYSLGNLSYENANNPYTEGNYHKFNTDINHIRRLGSVTNIHVNFHGQIASRDLDGSEQFSLGGSGGIRAYPQGEANGDSGYQATAELRYATPVPYLSLATYIDWGEVTLSKRYAEHRNLMGWGLGVQYSKPNDYYLRVDYARKINGEKYQSEEPNRNGRWWFTTYKLF